MIDGRGVGLLVGLRDGAGIGTVDGNNVGAFVGAGDCAAVIIIYDNIKKKVLILAI